MAQLLPEQLEFDFFAPPAPEKLKQSENKAKSTAFKDTDILKFQLNKDGSRKLEDFGEDLNNTRKGRSRTTSDIDRFLELPESDLQKRLGSEPLEKVWPKAAIQALAKDNPEAGACLWLVRQELGDVRPRQNSIKYRRYMATAKAAIDLHRQAAIGELAPEVQTAAFDSFYAVRDNYKYLSAIDPKYWPMLGHHYFKDVADICKYNDYSAAAPGTENARQILSDLTEEEANVSPTSESSTEDKTSESSEESDSALLASLEEFSDESDSGNKVESIAIHADIEETHLSEITEPDTEPEETQTTAQNVTDITANITADVTADWDEKRCADFAASLISQIKLQLKEQKVSEASDQEAFPVEQKTELTGSETPTSKDEGDKQKEYFRHVQKIRNAYRKVARNPLASRRKIS